MRVFKNKVFCDVMFLAALAFKIFSHGIKYFPILDDYIQYGGYPLYKDVSHVFLNIGTIATRPFASLIDPTVWGQFYPNLFVVLAIISALFFIGTKLIAQTFEKLEIHITPFLYAILLLCPLGFEGTYWISASSRICVGLFFTGLALYLLTEAIHKKNKLWLLGYIVCAFLSFGFYESVMVLSAILQFAVILRLVKNKKKCFLYMLVPIICGILMVVYYKFAGTIGVLGSRANGFSFIGFGTKPSSFFTQFFEILIIGGIKTTFVGAYHGIMLMVASYQGLVALIFACLISVLCAYFGAKKEFHTRTLYSVILGLALTVLPLLPNILTNEVWLTYRSIVPCFIGLTILSSPIFCAVLKKKNSRIVVLFLMVFIFLSANYNELDTYKRVNQTDSKIVTEIAQKLDKEVLSGKKETVVVLDSEVIVPQTNYYKDHVKSVTDSDWALTGAVRAKMRNVGIKMITPVYSLDGIDTHGKQIIYIGGIYE